MIIERMEVRNYRAVADASVELDALTYLVGRNGAGKSTLLNALALFFGRLRASELDCTGGCVEDPIEVSLTFANLGQAAEEFRKYVRDQRLRVTKRIRFDGGRPAESYHGSSLSYPGFVELRALAPGQKLVSYRELRDTYGMPPARSAADVDAALDAWEGANPEQLQLTEDSGNFFGYRNVAAGKLDRFIDFVLVPAVRDAVADASEGRDSTLKLLIDAVVRRTVNLTAPVAELRERMSREYGRLLESPEMSLDDVQNRVTSAMQRYAPGTEVAFRWERLEETRLPEPTVAARLVDDGVEGEVSSKGHGLQRAYVMATLQALAEAESTREPGAGGTEERSRGLVLAVEEPELYQHPAQARRIGQTFRQLTDDDSGIQVIACTHSPLFLDLGSFDRVRLVRKPGPSASPRTSISRATLNDVAQRLNEIHQDGRTRTGMGLQPGLVGLLNPYTNEAFFADFVVLVEGEEDKALLEAALSEVLTSPRMQQRAIVVVPAGGKKNLDKMHSIVTALGIPSYLVFDQDGESGEDLSQVEHWNVALQRMLGVEVPQGVPPTTVSATHAILSPNLTRVVKGEIGDDAWNEVRQATCDELTLDVRRGVEKNPVVIRRMLVRATARNARSTTLEAVARMISEALMATFTDPDADVAQITSAVDTASGDIA